MIPYDAVKAVLKALATDLSVSWIRFNQSIPLETYPYMSYGIILSVDESAHQNVIEVTENILDSTSADVTKKEQTTGTISINFHDKEKIDRITALATEAIRYFKSIAGMEVAIENNIRVQLISPSVEDRSILLDNAYHEQRYGFDLAFVYESSFTETIASIETIVLTPTIDGTEGEDIIIEEN